MDKAFSSTYLEVPVHNLERGMFVAELDRPWLETPFLLQGFYIQSDAEILELSRYCSTVYVDPRRVERNGFSPREPSPPQDLLRDHFKVAKVDYESAGEAVRKVFIKIQDGGELNVAAVESAISPLIRSVVSHKEALAALARMKRKDDYLYNHAISTAVWAALIGQQLGLHKSLLKSLAVGAAMQDLGKTRIKSEVLNKAGPLDEREWQLIKKHVQFTLALIEDKSHVEPEVLDIIEHHHERYDGSGYPNGLLANRIPLLAQIAGLADTYDAMLTPRPYARPHTSFSAVQELIDMQGSLFSKPLIEQFVQAVGLFPTGSLVELNTGEVGIVVAQNNVRRLRPKVMLVMSRDGKRIANPTTIDLMKYAQDTHGQDPVWIVKELEPGTHGLDASEYFL
ncbi:MAG: HD-GYP domain-containing protein [Pseudomonadota bacterium]